MNSRIARRIAALVTAVVLALVGGTVAYAHQYGTISTSVGSINAQTTDWFPSQSTWSGLATNTSPFVYANRTSVTLYDYCPTFGLHYIGGSSITQYNVDYGSSGVASGAYIISCTSGHTYSNISNHEIQPTNGATWEGGGLSHNH